MRKGWGIWETYSHFACMLRVMDTTLTVTPLSPHKIEWMAVWMVIRKRGANFEELCGIAQKKNEWRPGREMTLEKWLTTRPTELFIIYCIFYLHHSLYIFSWESLQNVSPKTLKGTYSEEMRPGFQMIRVQLISYWFFLIYFCFLNWDSSLIPGV